VGAAVEGETDGHKYGHVAKDSGRVATGRHSNSRASVPGGVKSRCSHKLGQKCCGCDAEATTSGGREEVMPRHIDEPRGEVGVVVTTFTTQQLSW